MVETIHRQSGFAPLLESASQHPDLTTRWKGGNGHARHGFVVAAVKNDYISRRNRMEQSLPIEVRDLQGITDREGEAVQLMPASQVEKDRPVCQRKRLK